LLPFIFVFVFVFVFVVSYLCCFVVVVSLSYRTIACALWLDVARNPNANLCDIFCGIYVLRKYVVFVFVVAVSYLSPRSFGFAA
jgi:hypothetical protein